MRTISKSKFITEAIIKKYPNLGWNLEGLTLNPNLTFEFFKTLPYEKKNHMNILIIMNMLIIYQNIQILPLK